MTLQHWMLLWKIVLIGGISLFSILAVVVSIGGFFDIRRLFRKLHAQHAAYEQTLMRPLTLHTFAPWSAISRTLTSGVSSGQKT